MIIQITSKLIKRVLYLGPVIQGIEIALDAKKIIESSTQIGVTKTISGRFLKDCTPSEILIAGKCLMLLGGVVGSVNTTGNPLVVSGTMSATRSRMKQYKTSIHQGIAVLYCFILDLQHVCISTQPLSHTSRPFK